MNASDRRHTRYSVPEGSLANQKIRSKGLLSGLMGWADCRVRDLSIAGALVLASKSHGPGDSILVKLTLRSGEELVYCGKVVNSSIDARQESTYRLGIALSDVKPGTPEFEFLHDMESVFPPAI